MRELRDLAGKITRLTNVVLGIMGARPVQDEAKKYLTAHAGHSEGSDRMAKHKAIVARVLPNKGASEAESPTAHDAPLEK